MGAAQPTEVPRGWDGAMSDCPSQGRRGGVIKELCNRAASQPASQSVSQSTSGVDERKDAKTLTHADIETDGDGEEVKGREGKERSEGKRKEREGGRLCMPVCLTVSAVSRD